MDKKKTPSDRALRSDHPRKKLRNRSATPKSNPETSVTAPKKVKKHPRPLHTPKNKARFRILGVKINAINGRTKK